MLHGLKEGVIALDPHQRITLINDSARRLLALPPDCVGRDLDDLAVQEQLREVLTQTQPGPDRLVLVGERVLAFNRMPMRSHGRVIGSVTTLRDRTELSCLEKELGATRTTTDTLRAQTHEFANQLHTISGLIQLEEYEEVIRFVDGVHRSRTRLYDDVTTRVGDPALAALVIAKASLAAERGGGPAPAPRLPRRAGGRGALPGDLTTMVGTSWTTRWTPSGTPPSHRWRSACRRTQTRCESRSATQDRALHRNASMTSFSRGTPPSHPPGQAGAGSGSLSLGSSAASAAVR